MARKATITSSMKAPPSLRRTARVAARATRRPLQELSVVRLAAELDLGDGRTLPAGAEGAIVFVHGGGEAYEVEFVAPFHAIATVPAPNLS